jgi:hypothetical protein
MLGLLELGRRVCVPAKQKFTGSADESTENLESLSPSLSSKLVVICDVYYSLMLIKHCGLLEYRWEESVSSFTQEFGLPGNVHQKVEVSLPSFSVQIDDDYIDPYLIYCSAW